MENKLSIMKKLYFLFILLLPFVSCKKEITVNKEQIVDNIIYELIADIRKEIGFPIKDHLYLFRQGYIHGIDLIHFG